MTFATETDRATVFPVFLALDTSYSMHGDRIAAANAMGPELIDACLADPALDSKTRVEIIEFNSRARVLVPSAKATEIGDLPPLEAEGATVYSQAFDLLRQRIETVGAEIRADGFRVMRPAVFFITDGEPTDNEAVRDRAFAQLTAADFDLHPNICTFGVGEAALDGGEMLRRYRSHRGVAVAARGDAAAALREIIAAITQSVIGTAAAVVVGEGFVFPVEDLENEDFDIWANDDDGQ